MDIRKFRRVCNYHGVIYTDAELVSLAYLMAEGCTSWAEWYRELASICKTEEIKKIIQASETLLNRLPSDSEGLRSVTVSPAQTVNSSMSESLIVPMKFLKYVSGL
ncbi:hypothetical protein SAMN02745181_0515 [Rubritalea squalenifaciens DSM 18772]|uniref:Uncharacterized protein n=1 Tax=Rubritalea squalenifaciens DSM 18772 TaxID=1123071 RepID=A0A1M6CMJ5_9BACT|nr:hypothetical protein SAMN02745181_0515 [Rubritalea squalenifaciens DSM 18772]